MQKQKVAKIKFNSPICKSRSLHLSAPEVHASGILIYRAFYSLVEVKHGSRNTRGNFYHPAYRYMDCLCNGATSKALYNEVEKGKGRSVLSAVNRLTKNLGEEII